jgi:ceramide glucosyltransferase
MTQLIHLWLMCCGFALTAFAMSYSIMAWYAVSEPIRSSPFTARGMPPVTMLKPLCGAELETYECLRSFCVQEYPEYQIVFGVADANDPSVAIVEKLQREFPQLDLQIAIDRRQHGSSRKVSNLMNMMALARHEFLVLSDSDVRVGPDYLAVVVAPLLDKSVGIVTCPYRGIPRHGVWALLGSLYINEWFMPSVRVAAMSGSRSFAFGATIAMRREVLTSIGGFSRIANQLADDYLLGELTRRLGLRTVLSEVVVDVFVTERSVGELVRHELRWLRTIRAVRPVGYAFSFITFGTPVAALGCLLASNSATAIGMLAMTVLTRVMLHVRTRKRGSAISQLFLWPLRDTLSLGLWCWSFVTRRVHWRDDRYRVSRDGTAWRVEAM